MNIKTPLFAIGLSLATVSAHAGLVSTITDTTAGLSGSVDNVLGANEYGAGNAQKVLGGGSGFGGTVGGASLYMDASAGDLKLGFQPGADLNDIFVLYLDTQAGGFTDAQLSDNSDGGRTAITNPRFNGSVVLDTGFLPDYALAVGNFGIAAFGLQTGTLNYLGGEFTNNASSSASLFREISFSKSLFGLGANGSFDFVGLYTSGGGYLSDESIPGGLPAGNPGDAAGTTTLLAHDRFQAVPEPGTWAALGLGAMVALKRRRK